ncbi:heparinase II/III family protein [Flammeovirgaceae bacterium 311]|nr:heparinase II/III family protein [Flammeovirgaceae bacterium 311]
MSSRSFFVFIAFSWLALGTAANAQQPLSLAQQIPAHPRIMLLEGEEEGIRKTLAADATWSALHAAILGECNQMLTEDLPKREMVGRRLLSVSRNSLRNIFYLSYAWRISREEQYLKRAEAELLAVCAFSDWNPSHFLDVAEMTMGVAIGYDWLFSALSDSSKMIIREAIMKKGIEPSLDPAYNGWLQESHNWNQVGNAGMLFGALAIYEDEPELALKIMERGIETIVLPMQDYGPDGAYPEGYSYWGYGTSFNVMFISALEKVFGQDFGLSEQQGFLKTPGYMLHMTAPSGKAFNYSDSGTGGGLQPAMFWFAGKLKDPSLLWVEKKKLIEENAANHARNRLLPAIMIWNRGIEMDRITPPKDKLWAGKGKNPVALMRTSWTSPQAIFVGTKGGSPSVNHGHMDAGSFIMEASGIRWAMDFGTENYTALEAKGIDLWNRSQASQRWQVFRYSNQAHNTLTVNNEPQRTEAFAPLSSWSAKPDFMHAVVDLSEIYAPSLTAAQRGIAIIDQQYVEVRDEIKPANRETTTIRWSLLTAAEVEITGKNTMLLTKDGKKLLLKVVSPKNIRLTTWSTESPNDYDSPNPGTILTGFETTLRKGKKGTLRVQLIPQTNIKITTRPAAPLKEWPE